MALVLNHQTKAAFAGRFWTKCKELNQNTDKESKIELHKLIWWLVEKVSSGNFTNNQVRLSFNSAFERNLDAAQWLAFATTRLQPMHDRYQAFLDEVSL